MSAILMTTDGLERLHAELGRLHAERQEILLRMSTAIAYDGSLAENGEYLDAQADLALVERRIELLERRAEAAEVVERRPPDGALDVGETVRVRDAGTGEELEWRIVGEAEGDPARGEISYRSPVGAALLGRRAGDAVAVETPRGTLWLEVLAVRE